MKKYIVKMQARVFDVEAKKMVCILNEADAKELGVFALDRIHVSNPKTKNFIHSVVDLTDSFVKKRQIGMFKDIAQLLNIKNGSEALVSAESQPKSISYIRDKLDGKTLSKEQLMEIVSDMKSNKLSDVEATAFVTAVYINGFDLSETIAMTKALVKGGKKISFNGSKKVVDKHSIGGTNGRTTLIVVPIIAANGLFIPKTSSRTITSAAGTADAMETLAPVNLSIEKIKSITEKIGGVIVWGGAVDLAPVDDKIIKIEHPLSLDPQGQVIASVMAKKSSAGAKFLAIDLPIGFEAKIKDKKHGKEISKKFIAVGEELGIKVKTMLSDGETPSGKAFGPALEAKYALETLEGKIFDNLAEKSLQIAGALLELSGKEALGHGVAAAKKTLESGAALHKMKEIIRAQGGKVFSSEQLKPAEFKKTVFSKKSGKIKKIHIKKCIEIARLAGAPADKKAGVLLSKNTGEFAEKNRPLFEIFAENREKLALALSYARKNNPVEIE
ncbi:MAG: AMP phosphorylase [archaeon]